MVFMKNQHYFVLKALTVLTKTLNGGNIHELYIQVFVMQ